MIYTLNLGACMQPENKVAKRSGYIINRIYTLDTGDEHILEQVVRIATLKFNQYEWLGSYKAYVTDYNGLKQPDNKCI
jgi:hypothetical protein